MLLLRKVNSKGTEILRFSYEPPVYAKLWAQRFQGFAE